MRSRSDLYAALGLVAVSVVLMVAGVRSIVPVQIAVAAVTVWGALRGVVRAPELWRWANAAALPVLAQRAVLAAAMIWTVVFWSGIFRSHVALPIYHDGIAHTTYYLRILEAGVPTLGRVPIGFGGLFGVQLFPFYPTGTHTLMAVTGGLWGEWGIVSHAGVLKACFTLTLAALPWAMYWFLRNVLPAMPWWAGLAVVLIAIPGFRFPVEAAHEGGASRLIAHLVLIPIYAEAVLGRFDPFGRRAAGGVVLGCAFLMHPSTFVMLAALMTYSTVFAAAAERQLGAGARRFGGLALSVAIAGLIIAGVLAWNHAAAEARDVTLPFSWTALIARWVEGWSTLFNAEYGTASLHPWLVGFGILVLVVGRRRLGVSGRAAGLPFWMVMMTLLVLAARLIDVAPMRMLGGAFYDEIPRVIEPLFETIGLCLAIALWGVWKLVAGTGGGLSLSLMSGRARISTVLAAGIVLVALGYQVGRRPWLVRHISYWDRQFQTPRIGNLQDVGTWIVEHSERNAVLFHEPFDSEIWEAWTGRRGIFMYAECLVTNHLVPCAKRKAFVADQIDALRRRMAEPTPDARCLAPVDAFNRPAYFLVPANPSSARSIALCRDATLVGTFDRHAVIEYRKPEPALR